MNDENQKSSCDGISRIICIYIYICNAALHQQEGQVSAHVDVLYIFTVNFIDKCVDFDM